MERNGTHSANLQPEKRATRQLDSELTDFRVNKSVAALLEVGKAVQGLQGHKSLLWLSGSFPAALIPTNLTGLNPDMEGTYGGYLYGNPRQYSGVIAKATQVLSAENIAVYPVDAQGLQGSMTDASQQSFRYYVNPIYQANYERQEAMRDVADLTGGRPFYNHNDIGHELSRLITMQTVFTPWLSLRPKPSRMERCTLSGLNAGALESSLGIVKAILRMIDGPPSAQGVLN